MRPGRTMILIIKQVFLHLGLSLTESANFLAPAEQASFNRGNTR
jgi:hypothetical protein